MKLLYSQLVEEYGITYLLTDKGPVSTEYIDFIDIQDIEQGRAVVHTYKGELEVTGFAALELTWMLKPSALEGKRLTWQKNSWIVHNLFAHPLMQLLAFVGLYKWAMIVHDRTVPKPIGLKCNTN